MSVARANQGQFRGGPLHHETGTIDALLSRPRAFLTLCAFDGRCGRCRRQHPGRGDRHVDGPDHDRARPKAAPITVDNFLNYVDSGFYDGLIFHRVIPGFMIQGGGLDDKMNEKTEGARRRSRMRPSNGLSNKRGTIAMARTSDPDSATSQFFINHADNARGLDRAPARPATRSSAR